MQHLSVPAIVLAIGLSGGAADLAGASGSPAPDEPDARPQGETPNPPPAAVRAALRRAIAESGRRASLRVFVECSRDGRLPSVDAFGTGIGIWDGRRQFRLSPAEISSLLAAAEKVDFAGLKASYGGRDEFDEPRGETPHHAPELKQTCRVRLSLDGLTKEVVQLEGGEQSPALRDLADSVFRICEEPARSGVEAKDLTDGLEKLSRGQLAPETFALMLHRKPELAAPRAEGGGFLLRISGRALQVRVYSRASGYGAPLSLDLGTAGLETLAAELAARHPDELPTNLYAPEYTDLSIEVLNRAVSVQARRFTGMTPSTHGERQADFDAIFAALRRLQERVVREGHPDPDE
jgi:hypothetical protein